MKRKDVVAMILAGGQGSRLYPLTKTIAKPAIHFGGRYRIIDFSLSNCSNSGIDTVGILTQYEPFELNSHIGIGIPWDLDRSFGGVSVLPPYTKEDGGRWYKGTANAIYQNFSFIDRYNPKYVLILSGDHIYKMNYEGIINYHIEKKADATIAVLDVSLDEASRFGIMNTDENFKVNSFDEKPENPKSTLASMGVYVFSWETLKKVLTIDEQDKESNNDFGKNIIPKMLEANLNIYAYPFSGYWKDVGTIKSLWEAHMDLLNENNELDIFDSSWKIYSPETPNPPQFIGENAFISNSMVLEGCTILGSVKNSILFPGVFIGENAIIENSIIFPDSIINSKCIIKKSIIGHKSILKENVIVGNGINVAVIENGKEICKNSKII